MKGRERRRISYWDANMEGEDGKGMLVGEL